jgi:hypothetical protein
LKPASSRLLLRIEAALADSRDSARIACLRAERAGYRARLGSIDEARAELDALRAQFTARPLPEVGVWLSLLEAWIAYFDRLDGAALDRMKRAHAMSVAAGLRPLRALAAAWLAHLHYADNAFEPAARSVEEVFAQTAAHDHAARGRAALVAAQAHHFAGRFDLAQPWYSQARTHARAEGDAQLLSALVYDMAALQIGQALQDAVLGDADTGEQARQAAAAIESVGSFDDWMGTHALPALLPLMRAAAASLTGEHAQALRLYGDGDFGDAPRALARIVPVLHAERAWCRHHTGDTAGAQADARAAIEALSSEAAAAMHPDARAIAHGRLGRLFELTGDDEARASHMAQARQALDEHVALQSRAAQAFAALETPPS